MDWSQWVQNVTGQVVDRYTQVKQMEAATDAMRLQALGQNGYYLEGQRGTILPVNGQGIGGIPSGVLIVGALVLVAVMVAGD